MYFSRHFASSLWSNNMQNCIQHWRRKDWFWHSRNPVTKLLEYKFYQDLSRNYDQESSQGNQTANSLLSLIADGAFRATNLGRDFWKALIGPDGSLQLNCNREGPNAVCSENVTPSKARIGIVANNQNFCYSCDSRIGFRMEGYPDDSLTCGNGPRNYRDTGDN